MTWTQYRLTLALALSLLLHLAPFIEGLFEPAPKSAAPPPLKAELRRTPSLPTPSLPTPSLPTPSLPAPVPLTLPEPQRPAPVAKTTPPAKKVMTAPTGKRNWQDEIRQQFRKQHERQEFYPVEAIRQGIEGEALVLVMLDPNGQVSAARIEESSGHRILDDAALRAVRALRSLPADVPRETLLPVRFRLR